MSTEDTLVRAIVTDMIPVVKRRVVIAMERSRENVEDELATLADLFIIQDRLAA